MQAPAFAATPTIHHRGKYSADCLNLGLPSHDPGIWMLDLIVFAHIFEPRFHYTGLKGIEGTSLNGWRSEGGPRGTGLCLGSTFDGREADDLPLTVGGENVFTECSKAQSFSTGRS